MNRTVLAVVGVLALLLAACADDQGSADGGDAAGDDDALQQVTLRLDWLYGSEHAPYFIAQEQGYFEEEGLEVDIREGEGSATTATLVGTGDDDFGIIAAGTVLTSVNEGVPITTLATIFQDTPTAVIIHPDSDIDELEDLYGQELGLMPRSVTYNEWEAVARINDIDRDQINEVSMDRTVVEPLLSGRVDAAIAWALNDGTQIRQEGVDAEFIPFPELGLDIPASTLATSTDMLEDNPEAVEGMVNAVLRGWEFAMNNPDEALDIFFAQETGAEEDFNREKFPIALDLAGDPDTVGHNDEDAWSALIDLYLDAELLDEPLAIDDVITEGFAD